MVESSMGNIDEKYYLMEYDGTLKDYLEHHVSTPHADAGSSWYQVSNGFQDVDKSSLIIFVFYETGFYYIFRVSFNGKL